MLALGIAGTLLVVRVLSPGIPDAGDGVNHYQHARYFWQHAEVALSQWGKPVFSLLASPFSMLGLWGMAAFNALVATATCWAIMRALGRRLQAWWWLVPVVLLTSPQYVHTVLAGLTEPLFGLCAVLVVWALMERWHTVAMVLVSVSPFVRPEYAAFAPFAVSVVIMRRELKALPWLLLGVALYSVLTGVLLGKPLMFFEEHTYAGKDMYGPGDLLHFAHKLDVTFGLPLKRMMLVPVLVFPVLLWRDVGGRRRHLELTALTLLPAVGIFALHSYAYWKGGMGSLGLVRVMATTVPWLVLFMVHVLGSLWSLLMPSRWWSRTVLALFVLLHGNVGYHELRHRLRLPYADDEVQRVQREAADLVNERRAPGERVITLDPLVALHTGVDPWDPDAYLPIDGFWRLVHPEGARAGDWIVWDAHFAANQAGVSADTLMKDPRFRPVAVLEPPMPLTTLGGHLYGMRVFQRSAGDWEQVKESLFVFGTGSGDLVLERCDTLPSRGGGHTFSGTEFPFTLAGLPAGGQLEVETLEVAIGLDGLDEQDTLLLVLAREDGASGTRFQDQRLVAGDQVVRFPVAATDAGSGKLYLWNRSGSSFQLIRFRVLREGYLRDADRAAHDQ